MTARVLFVCLGNICRSPTAEAVARAMAEAEGLEAVFDSAGTGDWHLGHPPYPPAIRAGAERGYDLSPLRARQVTATDFAAFDHILAMDRANLDALNRLRPDGTGPRPRLFLDYAEGVGTEEVPDPYFTGDFDDTLDLIEAASRGLIAQLRQKDSAVAPNSR